MPYEGSPPAPPFFWEAFGHSYFMTTVGTLNQTGRMDAIVRQNLAVDHFCWRNRCVTGAQIASQGRSQGGYTRMMQECIKSQRTAPYAGNGGGCFLIYGINDIGLTGKTLQMQTAFGHALRACISRWRASSIKEDSDASIAYGAGFTSAGGTQDFTSGTTVHKCTVTTNSTITITLPADYTGQTIAVQFIGASGVFGGAGTFSGTASFASGTLSTSNIHPSSHCPVVRRFRGVPADAGKTLIFTATAVDTSGEIDFDCWWIEADNPPPVVVCNIPRCLAVGYASYAQTPADSDIANFNGVITSVVGEFDGMVQIANLDTALNKDLTNPPGITTLYASDGIHPNEFGAARCADAITSAVHSMTIPGALGPSAYMVVDAPQASAVRRPRLSQVYYLPEFASFDATAYTAVTGHLFALPVIVSEGRERWIQFQLEITNAPTTGSSLRWGIYDDVGWTGYPQCLITEATSGGALSFGTAAAILTSSATLNQPLDPGLYWIGVKMDTIVATAPNIRAIKGPSLLLPATSWVAGTPPQDCAWRVTGLTAGALPTTFTTGGTPAGSAAGSVPCVGFKTN